MIYHSQEYAKTQIKADPKKVMEIPAAYSRRLAKIDTSWIAKGKVYKTVELRNTRMQYAQRDKMYSIQWLTEVFPKTVMRILGGEVITIEDFRKTGYYRYLVSRLNPAVQTDMVPNRKGERHVWKFFIDLQNLCRDIREKGLKAPLDMYMDGGHPILTRGYRRLEILYQLGIETIPVRIWRNKWMARRFIPSAKWPVADNTIHGCAVKQFLKKNDRATDKYWVHGYTPYYDRHLQGRLEESLKVLELGVLRGESLQLWASALPNAEIYGIDLEVRMKDTDRIKIFQGDEKDLSFLDRIGREYGPFDMIVDDALHIPDPQKNAFNALWPHVNEGGLYVLEDYHINYMKKYEKTSAMPTFLAKVKDMMTAPHDAKGVSFYPNICFVEKA
jgi:hypothetical protein